MAVTLIRTKTGTATTSTTLTIGSATTFVAGNLVVGGIRGITGTASITNITDDKSNTYTVIAGPLNNTSGDTRDWMFSGIQIIGAATTITVTFDAAITSSGYLSEFSGAGPFDKASTGQAASGTSGSVSSFSPTNGSGELIYVFNDWRNTTSSPVAGTNYTLISNTTVQAVMYNPSSSASETAPITWTTSVVWNELAAAFFTTTTSTSFSSSTSTSISTSTTTSVSTSTSISTTSSSTSSTSTSTSTTTIITDDRPIGTIKFQKPASITINDSGPVGIIGQQRQTSLPTVSDATLVDDTVELVDSASAVVGGKAVNYSGTMTRVDGFIPKAVIRRGR